MIRKSWAAVPVALSPWQLSQAVVTLNASSVMMNKFRLNLLGFHTYYLLMKKVFNVEKHTSSLIRDEKD